jgi:hypothetical protein
MLTPSEDKKEYSGTVTKGGYYRLYLVNCDKLPVSGLIRYVSRLVYRALLKSAELVVYGLCL